jgi:hypothetical protein
VKKKQDLEENIFVFVDISHRGYKLRRDVEQTPSSEHHAHCAQYFVFLLQHTYEKIQVVKDRNCFQSSGN